MESGKVQWSLIYASFVLPNPPPRILPPPLQSSSRQGAIGGHDDLHPAQVVKAIELIQELHPPKKQNQRLITGHVTRRRKSFLLRSRDAPRASRRGDDGTGEIAGWIEDGMASGGGPFGRSNSIHETLSGATCLADDDVQVQASQS